MQVANLVIDMAANVARLRNDMDQARKVVEGTTAKMAKAAEMAGKALSLIGAGVGVASLTNMVNQFARASTELSNLSRLANSTAEDFQKISFAANKFGVSQEKLADILKDTQDKVGDFMQTGGGAMADFFEKVAPKVGVTADQFRRLNGADALQLYVSSLEKANLSQSDMVFYMEAIASDSTLLLPLLKDNGAAFNALSKEAEELGLIMSNEVIKAGREFDENTTKLSGSIRSLTVEIAGPLMSALANMTSEFLKAIRAGDTFFGVIARGLSGGVVGERSSLAQAGDDVARLRKELEAAQRVAGDSDVGTFEQTRVGLLSADLAKATKNYDDLAAAARRTFAENDPRRIQSIAEPFTKAAKESKAAVAKVKEAVDEFAPLYAKLMAPEGFESDYAKNMGILSKAYAEGKISLEELTAITDKYTKSQKFYTDQTKRVNDELDEYFKNEEAARVAKEGGIKSARELVEQIEFETQALTMTNSERELAIKLRALETAGLKEGSAEYEIYAQKIREAISGKAAIEESINQQKKAEADWAKTWDQVSQSFTNALMEGGRSVKEYLIGLFRTMVLRPVIMGTVGGITGMSAGSAGASGIEGIASTMAEKYITSAITGSILGSSAAYGAAIGTTSIAAGSQAAMLAAQTGSFGAAGLAATSSAAAGAGAGAAATGSSLMAGAAAAGPYVLAAVVALNALGVFRSNKVVGGGITGTLGGDDLQAYDLNRRGGSLFSGPSYSVRNERETEQTRALNQAFLSIRTGTVQMAKDLGLATTQVEGFTMSVGDVKVHPDIDKLGLVLDGLSDQEKLAKIEEVLQKSGNAMAELVLGAGATAQQLAQLYATVMQERAGLEMQLLQLQGNTVEIRKRERDALHESNRAIYDQIRALEDQKTANEDAAESIRSNTDAAYAALERAVNAQKRAATVTRDVAQQQVSSIKSIMDVLEGGIRNLFQGTREAAFQGMSFIDRALGTARSTGYLPDSQQLQQAITGATQGVTGRTFATKADQIEAQRLLAFKLKDLQDIAGTQLTEAERQLEVANKQLESLDAILENARAQIDALRGVDNSVMSVSLALKQLTSAFSLEEKNKGNESWVQSNGKKTWTSTGGAVATATGDSGYVISAINGQSFTGAYVAGWVQQQLADGNFKTVHQGALKTGISANSLDAIMGWQPGTANSLAEKNNLPKFANGGMHTGGMRLVGEYGPELEATGPARYYSASQTQSMLGGGVVDEIKGLREEVSMLRAEARATAVNTGRTQDIMKRVTRNGESMIVSTDGEALEVTS
jgi:hypothetical protein